MSTIYTNILSALDLQNIWAEAPLLLDCRHKLGDPTWGRTQFLQGHIEGAIHADMDQHLAAAPGSGGRHPLPDRTSWINQLRGWGLENDRQVVVYDDAGGAFAARAWWMLRWVGHNAVAVLDGGIGAWSSSLESGTPAPPNPGAFAASPPLVDIRTADEVTQMIEGQTSTGALVDARAMARWAGEEEPIDPIAGHIPTSSCLPFQGNLTADGTFLAASELQERFRSLADPITCYCGSGVTACHNILALHIAGRQAALFVDSWSGWITDTSRPVGRDQPERDT